VLLLQQRQTGSRLLELLLQFMDLMLHLLLVAVYLPTVRLQGRQGILQGTAAAVVQFVFGWSRRKAQHGTAAVVLSTKGHSA
jgi:hypothetical protein